MKLNRSICILLIAAIMLTCVPAVAFAATYPVSHIEEGDYYICASADSSFALSVVDSVTTQGTYFHLWEKIEGNPDQVFTIEHVSGDWYTIKVKKTSLCINVPGGNNANGQQLWTWPFDDTDSCLFRFASTNDGNYIIQSKLGRALDLDNNLLFNGSRTHLWDPHEGASGRWKLERVGGSREDSFSSAVYDKPLSISSVSLSKTSLNQNEAVWMTVAVSGGVDPYKLTWYCKTKAGQQLSSGTTTLQGANTFMQDFAFETSGDFVFEIRVSDTAGHTATKASNTITVKPRTTSELKSASLPQRYYSFVLKGSNLALDVKSGTDANGADIILYQSSNGNTAQLFEPVTTNGKVRLVAGCSASRVLDVLNRNLAPKAAVQLYDWNNTPAQHWVLKQDSNGYYVIQLAENPSLVLTAASNRSGTEVRLDTYTGSDLQKWSVKNHAENPRPVYKDAVVYDRENKTTQIGTIPAGRNVWPHSHTWDGKQLIVGVSNSGKELVDWIDINAFQENVVGTVNLPRDIGVTQAGSRTCTLAAATMMLRARAYLDGQDYHSITESRLRPTAWLEGAGLYLNFWYNGKNVACQKINSLNLDKKKEMLIKQLRAHPEGIVIWDDKKPHAVHLTHYKDGSFYVNDPANGRFSVRLDSCATIGGSGQDGKIARIYQFWHIAN